MPEPEGRNEKKQPKTRKNYKRKRQIPPKTAQMLNYVKKKRQAEQRKKQDAANNEYAVNEAENAAIDIALETANAFSRAKAKQDRDAGQNTAPHNQPHSGDPVTPPDATSQEVSLPSSRSGMPELKPSANSPQTKPNSLSNPHYNTSVPYSSRSTGAAPAGAAASGQSRLEPKVKPAFEPKTRTNIQRQSPRIGRPAKGAATEPINASSKRAVTLGRAKFRQEAQRELVRQSQKTAKAAGELAKKAATAAVNAIRSTAGLLAGACGGVVLAVVIGIILLIGAVAVSPFGVLFSTNATEDATTLATAMAQIDQEYATKINQLKDGEYSEIQIQGSPPDWREVIAVFACKTAWGEDGLDVIYIDTSKVDLLRTVFWDMCTITSETEIPPTEPPGTGPEGSTEATPPLPILHITITSKTAAEMAAVYNFTESQRKAMENLLANADTLEELLGDLTFSSGEGAELLVGMPGDVSATRRKVVEQALTLVGKVNYFWGGKSLVIGWDSRWGKMYKVAAAGSPTTGTMRPYGLDCSGFVDWVFYNVSGGSYVLGHGGGVATQHVYCKSIPWEEAKPGDLVFYSGDTHVGIIGGWDDAGNIQIIHCESGNNNVVITGKMRFASVGRPYYYGE